MYLPPGVRPDPLPSRFDRIDHASLFENASLESRWPLLYVASSLVDTIARRVRSCPLVAGLVGVGGPAVACRVFRPVLQSCNARLATLVRLRSSRLINTYVEELK